MPMTKSELARLYNEQSEMLVGTLPSEKDIDELYVAYKAGIEFTECENEIIFEVVDGELDISFKPMDVFPLTNS